MGNTDEVLLEEIREYKVHILVLYILLAFTILQYFDCIVRIIVCCLLTVTKYCATAV